MGQLDNNKIQSKIRQISEALDWIRENKSELYQQKFLQLVPLKCELRKMLYAGDEKPAIAAYGESQKGKSYLMGNLLQKNGMPFKVRCGEKDYDFVAQINPIGDRREATGVVTRFTSYIGHEDRYSDEFPARMKVMSVANVVTILLDGYFNDILDDKRYSDQEIQEKADKIFERYVNEEPVQDVVTEDDIIDIKMYLRKFINTSKISAFCENTDFFNKIALVIRNIPQNEWVKVFSILWHDNKDITALFLRLLKCIQKMKFAKVVYLPVEAVLHKGDNKNTIMSVDCLNGLYSKTEAPTFSDVYLKTETGYERLCNFDKSELSALCLEVSYKVDLKYLDDKAEFYFDKERAGEPGYMSEEVYSKLTVDGQYISKRRLLESSDLLDFPGAKNREQMKEETLERYDDETQQSNLVKLYLRGKVAFLFNHFSDSRVLNILMFCHNAEDVKVTQMYNVIDSWINTYVGDTEEKRKATLKLAGNVAPFFAIGTMFNIDMTMKSNVEANSDVSLQGRWKGRFSKVMYQDCFHAGTDVDWFKNWTAKGINFDNTSNTSFAPLSLSSIKQLINVLTTKPLKEKGINIPTRDNIIEYRDYLIEKHKPKTVNLYLTALKNFYSWLEYEEITKNITKNIKNIKLESIHLKRGLSKEEIVDVLNSCKDLRETLLIKLMITCALRVNEVCNIQLSDFFNDNGVVMLKVLGKGRQGLKQDVVKIDDRIYELIKEYVNQYGIKDYLFVSTSNNSLGKSISTTAMRKIVNNIFKRANLDMEMLSPHSTRHTSVELALESGLSIQEVSQMVRHKNIQTTIVYSKELEKRNSKFANVLADMIF